MSLARFTKIAGLSKINSTFTIKLGIIDCVITGGVRTQIGLNLKLNTFGVIERCYLSFDSTPDISNDTFMHLQVLKWFN